MAFACMTANAQEVGGGNHATDVKAVQPPIEEADTFNAIKTVRVYTP